RSARYDAGKLPLDTQRIAERRRNSREKANAIIAYIRNDKICRTNQLLFYFGEERDVPCGICDVCLAQKREQNIPEIESKFRKGILNSLKSGLALPLEDLLSELAYQKNAFVVGLLREMEDEGLILTANDGKIKLKNP